jgi:hypothetical protein
MWNAKRRLLHHSPYPTYFKGLREKCQSNKWLIGKKTDDVPELVHLPDFVDSPL